NTKSKAGKACPDEEGLAQQSRAFGKEPSKMGGEDQRKDDARGRDVAADHAAAVSSSPSNRRRPSVRPCAASTTRSGCGIRPSTLPLSLRMPAMRRAEPLTSSR